MLSLHLDYADQNRHSGTDECLHCRLDSERSRTTVGQTLTFNGSKLSDSYAIQTTNSYYRPKNDLIFCVKQMCVILRAILAFELQ